MKTLFLFVFIGLLGSAQLLAQAPAAVDFNVSPNKAAEKFTIQVKQVPTETVTVTIYNIFGQNILQKTMAATVGSTNIFALKTAALALTGCYFVEVITGEHSATQTVTVE